MSIWIFSVCKKIEFVSFGVSYIPKKWIRAFFARAFFCKKMYPCFHFEFEKDEILLVCVSFRILWMMLKSMNLIFASLKRLKKHEYDFYEAVKLSKSLKTASKDPVWVPGKCSSFETERGKGIIPKHCTSEELPNNSAWTHPNCLGDNNHIFERILDS